MPSYIENIDPQDITTVHTIGARTPGLRDNQTGIVSTLPIEEAKPIFNYIKPTMSFQSGLENFTTNLGSISESIVSASDAVKNVKLPPLKTQSSVGISPTTFLGLGALIILFIYLRKKF